MLLGPTTRIHERNTRGHCPLFFASALLGSLSDLLSRLLLLLASLVSFSLAFSAVATHPRTQRKRAARRRERGEKESKEAGRVRRVSLGESAGDADRDTDASDVCLTGAARQKKTPVYWCLFLVALRDTTTLVCRCVSLFCQETSSDGERHRDTRVPLSLSAHTDSQATRSRSQQTRAHSKRTRA